MMARKRSFSTDADDVRMGPLALFTFLAIMCLSVLAVLCVSTANATLALSERRAEATTEVYRDEVAAQAFVAALDEQVVAGAQPETALDSARTAALDTTEGELSVVAAQDGEKYEASFDCGNGRQLNIVLTYKQDGTYRVEEWRMTTVVNDEPPMGNLLGSS